jgi:hypothetical protein
MNTRLLPKIILIFFFKLLKCFFSNSISQLNRTFDLTYTLPTHRATVYLMGFLVGYWMQQRGRLNISSVSIHLL